MVRRDLTSFGQCDKLTVVPVGMGGQAAARESGGKLILIGVQ